MTDNLGSSSVKGAEENKAKWRWCLVGNIVGEHSFGQDGETRIGTKQFPPGAKVYIDHNQWGDGYENVIVIGKPRKVKHLIEIVMPFKRIEAFRIQKVFNPAVLTMMEKSIWDWWTDSDEDRDWIILLLKSIEHNGIPIVKNSIWNQYQEAVVYEPSSDY